MAGSGHDAVVVGAGPNGLSAAIALAQSGLRVIVFEAAERAGGGLRSEQLTLPGFVHDVCSAVHPLALSSPFFRRLRLEEKGLEWVFPPVPLAHPLDDGSAVLLHRSVRETAENLGRDAAGYRELVAPWAENWEALAEALLRPLPLPPRPLAFVRFGLHALRSAATAARRFEGERARALLAGLAAHSMLPLERALTAGFAWVLATSAHAVGWPLAAGGSQAIADALVACLRELGGEVVTGRFVSSLAEIPAARLVLFDLTPRQLLALAGERLPPRFRRRLERYRYGAGAFKVDWALAEPIPWRAAECRLAGTVHLGGSFAEIAASERAAWEGRIAERPFVLLVQPSLFDPRRAPPGKHTAWAYCHVPNGSTVDMLARIEAQIERFAPGFRDCVIARSALSPAELQRHNPNLVGGDINGGAATLAQAFLRPTWRLYSTPAKGLYLCSASTPPGGGVHGMCGYFAALAALRRG